jgi:hypothetical protein
LISTRTEWRKLKEKYGIPDNVCSFSMGERIELWNKKLAAAGAGDYQGKVDAIDGLLKDLRAYDAALKSIKPTKFKGKTLAEQTKNLKDTQTAVHSEISSYDGVRNGNAALASPMTTLKTNLAAARAKFNTIHDTDVAALDAFYSAEYRNECGKFVALALTKNPTGKLKAALDNWKTAGDLVNSMLNSKTPTDPKKVYAACKMGIEGLAAEIL